MYYIGDQLLDFNTIKTVDPGTGRVAYYNGGDEVRLKIAAAWREIDERFLNKGQPVVFKTPGLRIEGTLKGKMGYSYPRSASVKTKKGKVIVRWCEEVVEEGGKKVYKPVNAKVNKERRIITLRENDIEEILWMFLFNPHVVGPNNPSGMTFIEDKEKDAEKYAASETSNAVIAYWLFHNTSPFYADNDKLDTLCLAWGIDSEGKSIAYKKQLLAEAVKKGEKANNPERNQKAFNDVCSRMKDGQDTRLVEMDALIQRCIGRKIIRLDTERFVWAILAEDGYTMQKTICKVPPQSMTHAKSILRQFLITNPDDAQILYSAIREEPRNDRMERLTLTMALPPPGEIDENYIRTELPVNSDMRKLWGYFGMDPKRFNKEDCSTLLIEKLVLNRIEVPHDVKAK